MSYGQNGINGYSNGYHNQEQTTRYDEARRDGGLMGEQLVGRRVRRNGGYGGFFTAAVSEQPELGQSEEPVSPESPDPFTAPRQPNWRRGYGRDVSDSGTRFGGSVNGPKLYGEGPGARQIEG